MATIVLVHGIAQEQYSADTLEAAWLPALAGGVRNSGDHGLADLLSRHPAGGRIDTRMAYYGDLFLSAGAQGPSSDPGDEATAELTERLARALLENAAAFAADPRDRAEAARRLGELDPRGEAQGARSALRPALNGLAALRWFAPLGVGVAGRTVWRAVSQVTRYLHDDEIRAQAQSRVRALIGPDTRLVIGHSLGSVVAYEALHHCEHPVALLTLGSPLGLRNIVYDLLRPAPPAVPPAVTRWDNLVDRDDLVAARIDLAELFPAAAGSTVLPVTAPTVDNGAEPHDATHYLTKVTVGGIVRAVLDPVTGDRVTCDG
ncbi:hypothetical protein IU510_01815 [Nocardia cyriacigeorgica]|uniref:hypothetical protein n=1 Tax=Nocardia cyriacigeorgica TaxID=135487 RepID=UPI001892D91F|nr:hypothetical protein [Nocardia cyriacigeorgica]MBF6096814.1 hypothetical protein [Nocardia cyriacigeorgica]MBF6158290.1 hypothetical protein [Nocardia cyriacigeorgica]MBF6198022.1 hypothetical protein [Nocardia cyriacigeorgica]MBF6316885.1 hypothetical protein [Nocardia cyriacigeorgica]MBF6345656.1 hypothetical protein [Nocardia cyriacigeorgica]